MSPKWNILQIGTKIRLKGESRKDDVDGIIKDYQTDDKRVINGYIVNAIDSSKGILLIALDDDIEVLKS